LISIIKPSIRKFLAIFGFELRRLQPPNQSWENHEARLQKAVQNGLNVNTVIDIGAAFGDWTRQSKKLFPQATYILVEPLAQYDEWLNLLIKEMPNSVRVKAAVSRSSGYITFFFHEDWVGSSLYSEAEGVQVDGTPLQVETITVDEIVQQQKLSGPFLLKIDVQGAELQVLAGATQVLQQTEYLIIETSLLQFFTKGPLIGDVVDYMQRRKFVIYDILGFQYRLLDNALGQLDLAFVPEHSILRHEHIYASPQQRRNQTEQFKRRMSNPKG
jgi:FkbM family methyltransferase